MGEYIRINEALERMAQAAGCQFAQIPRKRILFRGRKPSGETIALCTPQSKMHPQGFYWIDITEEQAHVLDATDKAFVVFRLEGKNLLTVNWEDLKSYLTLECRRYNAPEQNHWKLNIYADHIKISGNDREMPVIIRHFNPDV